MSFRIYTKTGDQGETSLFGGARVPKSHHRIEAYGTVDELNSWLGLVHDLTENDKHKKILRAVQDRLFVIGANLASDPSKNMSVPDLQESDILLLEKEMDEMDETLPPLKNFVIPGGHVAVSNAHIARCVCRRAERLVVLLSSDEPVEPIIIRYLNRLSDYLFILSRKFTQEFNTEELTWRAR